MCFLISGMFIVGKTLAAGNDQNLAKDSPGQQSFDIWEFEVEGNTLLTTETIERAVYPHLGSKRTIKDVEAARLRLEKEYRAKGYATVAVDIPEQRVTEGVIRLRVTESRVERVRVVGSRYYDQGRILARLPSVAPGTTPRFTSFQAELQTVNRFPGSRVAPVLRPGQRPATTEIDLNVVDENPLGAELELNNRYSPNTTHTRATASVSYANLWQMEHRVSLQYQTAPQKPQESKVWVVSYLMPVPNSDKLVALYAVDSKSQVAALSDFQVIGSGKIYGTRLVAPLPSGETFYQSLTVGLDYKDLDENVLQVGTPGVQTPIRYFPITLSYGGNAQDSRGRWDFSTGVALGLRGFGSRELDFDIKRFKARGNFLVWKWDALREHEISPRLSVALRLDGQVADQPLVSSEQFSAGGAGSVRGYLESEQIGDNGVHGMIELRGPTFWRQENSKRGVRPHLFFEGTHLWLNDPLPGAASQFTLLSGGIGLRANAGKYFEAAVDVAKPFRETTYTRPGDVRLQASARLRF
jgi:hemolysin activation/secretion protein